MTKLAKPTCETCQWYASREHECRRHAPQVTVLIMPQPGSIATGGKPSMGPVPIAAFPSIGEPKAIWCGDHEPAIALAH